MENAGVRHHLQHRFLQDFHIVPVAEVPLDSAQAAQGLIASGGVQYVDYLNEIACFLGRDAHRVQGRSIAIFLRFHHAAFERGPGLL